jgi:uncharacterized membrane protein YcgQ (UPF0703/DUF1980 family)
MKPFAFFFIVVAILAVLNAGVAQLATQDRFHVSILQLIATPEKFNGKRVIVTGFLYLGEESDELFVHREDEKNVILDNGIAILETAEMRKKKAELNLKYVRIEGRFKAWEREGHGFAGGVLEVERCQLWSDPDKPMKDELKRLTF